MLTSASPPFLLRRSISTIIGIGFVATLVLGVTSLQRSHLISVQSSEYLTANPAQQDQATNSALTLAQRVPTLGFDNLVADWFFLRFLQYFGDTEVRQATGYSLSPEFFKIIIPNDPHYQLFYIFLSGSTSNFAAQPEVSIDLISQGLERLTPTTPPDSFYFWRYKAVDELLYIGDSTAAQQSFQASADWARQSPHPDAAPIGENSQRTADFLAANPDSRRAQISSWASILGNAFDDATRQRAIDRIEALGGTVTIDEFGRASIQAPAED